MEAVIIKSGSKSQLKHLLAIAKELGMDIEKVGAQALEDMALAKAMDEGRTGKFVDNADFVKKLKSRL